MTCIFSQTWDEETEEYDDEEEECQIHHSYRYDDDHCLWAVQHPGEE